MMHDRWIAFCVYATLEWPKFKKNEHNVLLNMIKWVSEPLKSSGMEPMDFLPIVSCKRMEGLGTIVVFTF